MPPSRQARRHRPHTHPQVLRDHRGFLIHREPHPGLKRDPLRKRPTLSGQTPLSEYLTPPAHREDHEPSPPDSDPKTSVRIRADPRRRLNWWSQAKVRSTTQRVLPGPEPWATPRRDRHHLPRRTPHRRRLPPPHRLYAGVRGLDGEEAGVAAVGAGEQRRGKPAEGRGLESVSFRCGSGGCGCAHGHRLLLPGASVSFDATEAVARSSTKLRRIAEVHSRASIAARIKARAASP